MKICSFIKSMTDIFGKVNLDIYLSIFNNCTHLYILGSFQKYCFKYDIRSFLYKGHMNKRNAIHLQYHLNYDIYIIFAYIHIYLHIFYQFQFGENVSTYIIGDRCPFLLFYSVIFLSTHFSNPKQIVDERPWLFLRL